MVLKETYKLRNGVEIPKIGLGTWLVKNKDVSGAVKEAIKIGYRHIDTAQAYENETGVGEGIKSADINREDIFITSKIAAEIKSYDEAAKSIDESLKRLDTDYIDLMIIHSPKPWDEMDSEDHYFEGNREVWKALEEAYEAGKLRAIGVSNFEQVDIENILENCSVKPMINQIKIHIGHTPEKLIDYSQENDIYVEAYSPLAHGNLMDNGKVKEIAEKYDVSIPQLAVRYTLQLGLISLPKSTKPDHMKNNAELDFEITGEDMETLKKMKI